MSRIGRLPVEIPAGVTVTVTPDNYVTVKGPLGELKQFLNVKGSYTEVVDGVKKEVAGNLVEVEVKENLVHVTRKNDEKNVKAMHGLYRKLIANMVEGVTKGYSKTLVVNGVGYKVAKQGAKIVMNVGYSHPVEIVAPEGITLDTNGNTDIIVKGINKELVGQVSANIKAIKKPDPYHAYGVRYSDEVIVRKEGKTAGK